MEISTFKDMYFAELQELVSAEAQLDASKYEIDPEALSTRV